jgi:hypothetical protein
VNAEGRAGPSSSLEDPAVPPSTIRSCCVAARASPASWAPSESTLLARRIPPCCSGGGVQPRHEPVYDRRSWWYRSRTVAAARCPLAETRACPTDPSVLPVGSRCFRRLDVAWGDWIRRARQKSRPHAHHHPEHWRSRDSGRMIGRHSGGRLLRSCCCWTPHNVVIWTETTPDGLHEHRFVADPAESRLLAPWRGISDRFQMGDLERPYSP